MAAQVPRELNVFSKAFDPARALAAGLNNVPLPDPAAQMFDNIVTWPLRVLADDPTFDVAGQHKQASVLEKARQAAIHQVVDERATESRRKREELDRYWE